MYKNSGLGRPVLNNKINYPLCLAPMVGLSHVATRLLLRDYLPAGAETLWPTEMLSSRRLPKEDFAKTPEVMRGPLESGLVPQILGNEENLIAESVRKLVGWGAEAIDINMGCPVQKALKHNYGVALMGDSDYAARVVEMTVRNSAVPVSVKLRAGMQGDFAYLVKFVKALREAGAAWICLHPRTAGQKRRGIADWDQIRDLRSLVDFPIIGNGDIQTADDVFDMLEQTGCDMAMAGRALTARPWLLWQVGERLGFAPPPGREGEKAPHTPEQEGSEYGRSLLRLLDLMQEYFVTSSEDLALRKFRFYVRTSHVWLPFGNTLYGAVSKAKTVGETREALQNFFANSAHAMSKRTDLRQ